MRSQSGISRFRPRRLPLLLVYLVLLGSPVGRGGALWVHLETAHDDHRAVPAPNAPHAHDGVVHTHEDPTEDDAAVVIVAVSDLHLAPESPPIPILPSRTIADLPADEPARDHVPLIETPPPRLG